MYFKFFNINFKREPKSQQPYKQPIFTERVRLLPVPRRHHPAAPERRVPDELRGLSGQDQRGAEPARPAAAVRRAAAPGRRQGG